MIRWIGNTFFFAIEFPLLRVHDMVNGGFFDFAHERNVAFSQVFVPMQDSTGISGVGLVKSCEGSQAAGISLESCLPMWLEEASRRGGAVDFVSVLLPRLFGLRVLPIAL